MAWKDLSIAQRSQLMNLMRHNGISSLSEMRRLYDLSSTNLPIEEDTFNAKPVAPVYGNGGNKFYPGGTKGRIAEGARRLKEEASAAVGSVNEYIRERLEAARAAALEKSRTRTMPAIVGKVKATPEQLKFAIDEARIDAEQARNNARAYAEVDAEHWGEAIGKYGITSSVAPFRSEDRSQREHARLSELRYAKEMEDFANALESGDITLMKDGYTCINTATDNYGKQYRVSGNQTFANNPSKYGFMEVPVSEVKPGDLVQVLSGGVPDHAMIYDGLDEDGYPAFNYSNGGTGPESIVVRGFYGPKITPDFYKTFRFVGTPADSTRWRQEWLASQQKFGGKKFEGGGPEGEKGTSLVNFEYKPQNDGLPDELFKGVPYKPGYHVKLKSGEIVIPGLKNIDANIRSGSSEMYELWGDPRLKYLKNKDTGEYFEYVPRVNPDLDLSKYEEVTLNEIKKALPKRDYIGGEGYRLRTAQRIPGFIEEVGKRAKAYGLDPNVLLHRIMQEGYIDHVVRGYNNTSAANQKNYFTDPRVWTEPISGYGSFGLDYVGDELMKGLYTLKDPNATWTDVGDREDFEGGTHRIMHHSPQPDNLQSAIEMMAASMAYRQQQAIKMYPDAKNNPGLYVNASYNMGLSNSKMKDPEFVRRKYAYPNYGVFDTGGNKKRRETAYARKYREEQEAKAQREREHPTLKNVFRHDIASESGDEYYDVIKARYTQAMGALNRRGFTYEDASRLAPMIVAQNIVEGGWRVNRPDDNNFGGLRENGRFLLFDSPEEFYDNYLDLLDRKWGASRGPLNNWRNAQNLDDWSRILNREDLRLWSKERYNDYNREHRDNPVYLYAPEWENGGRSYRSHLAGVEARVNTYLDMVLKESPYTEEMYNGPAEPIAYQNDNFNLSMGQFQNLLESNRGELSKGGHKIHINPKNKGKFNALLKRTGKSASWFKAHGTPLQKKRATFALNSRHWGKKKLHGGVKF